MDSLRAPIHNLHEAAGLSPSSIHEVHTPDLLLKQAIASFTQGHYSESVSLLTAIRNQPSLQQEQFISFIDSIIRHHTQYVQMQETLLQLCRSLTHTEDTLQAAFTQLETLLYTTSVATAGHPSPTVLPPTTTILPKDVHTKQENEGLPALTITCFGLFEVHRNRHPVTLCQNRNGQAILRYLIAQPDHRATTDMLMDALWPDEEPETARRRLQVAISSLRCSLNAGYECDPGGGYILCKNRFYQIHPSVPLLIDVDTFVHHYETGHCLQNSETAHYYEQACQLYKGPFLPEDAYADWSQRRREQLSQMYQSMCAALATHAFQCDLYEKAIYWSQALLTENTCDEASHRLLIRSYARLSRRDEALKQYQRCERILREELGVTPMPETIQVLQDILVY